MYFKVFNIYSIFFIACATGYVFDCLDECKCDTDEEAIDCHDNSERTEIQLPKKRLQSFAILGLTKNNIQNLPSEKLLLEKLPHLKAIDVESNPNFNCSSLENYKTIVVLSDCNKHVRDRIIDVDNNNNETTLECVGDCNSQGLTFRQYIKALWKLIKEKYTVLKHNSIFVRDVDEFFSSLGQKMYNEVKKAFSDEKNNTKVTK